jgi:hypothetical protein
LVVECTLYKKYSKLITLIKCTWLHLHQLCNGNNVGLS